MAGFVTSAAAWIIGTWVASKIVRYASGGDEEEERTRQAIASAQGSRELLNPIIQEGISASEDIAMHERYGIDPQQLLTRATRMRAGNLNQEFLSSGGGLVEDIASRMGLSADELRRRLSPDRQGMGSLGQAAMGTLYTDQGK